MAPLRPYCASSGPRTSPFSTHWDADISLTGRTVVSRRSSWVTEPASSATEGSRAQPLSCQQRSSASGTSPTTSGSVRAASAASTATPTAPLRVVKTPSSTRTAATSPNQRRLVRLPSTSCCPSGTNTTAAAAASPQRQEAAYGVSTSSATNAISTRTRSTDVPAHPA